MTVIDHPSLISLFVILAGAITHNFIFRDRKRPGHTREARWLNMAEDVSLLGLGAAAAFTLVKLGLKYPDVGRLVMTPAGFALGGLTAGIVLVGLRQWRKDLYGMLEILVALTTLFLLGRAFEPAQMIAAGIGFMGAVYVFVRGVTNFTEGRSERRQPAEN